MWRNAVYFSLTIFTLSNTLASLYLEAYANSCYQWVRLVLLTEQLHLLKEEQTQKEALQNL